jgi:RNA polymerase sigma factor (sigma-70 family)
MKKEVETSIVIDAKSGNASAFGSLVQQYQNLVTSIAFSSTGDLQRSEDIAQQAFIIAWEKLTDLNDPAKFLPWLRSIARNTTLNSNRKTGLLDRRPTSLEANIEPVVAESPADAVSRKEQEQLLWASLERIPETYREPLVLFYRENQSAEQVASQLGLSEKAVRQRLSRGRAMLKNDVHQFVEDILGASKPDDSFRSAVLAALPAIASAAAKSAAAAGVNAAATNATKSAAAKTGLLTAATGMWVGLFGVIFGMNIASKHVGDTIEKNLLYRYRKIAVPLTFFVLSAAMMMLFIGAESTRKTVIIAAIAYLVLLTVVSFYFVIWQSRIDQRNGSPKPRHDLLSLQPATADKYRKSIKSTTFFCWLWIAFISNVSLDWGMLCVSVAAMIACGFWRLRGCEKADSIPKQMEYQATTYFINMTLSALMFCVAGWLGRKAQVFDHPNWQVSLIVLALGIVALFSIRNSAKRFRILESEARASTA